MGIYKIDKCTYCGSRNEIVRSTPFMADIPADMCQYCWNETKKEYLASHGEYILDFQSNKEEYEEIDKIQNAISYVEELSKLEEELRRVGYTNDIIEELKTTNGATEIRDFIDNLKGEIECLEG